MSEHGWCRKHGGALVPVEGTRNVTCTQCPKRPVTSGIRWGMTDDQADKVDKQEITA